MKFGVEFICFFDDVFAVNKPRLRKFLALMQQEGLTTKVKLYANSKADVIDDEICQLLLKLNLKTIFFGFESGSPKILKYLKCDKVSMEDNYKAILLGRKYNIRIFGNVIIGSPGETVDDIQQTIDFVNWAWRNKASRITASILIPYPGTEIWKVAKEMGRVSDTMNFDKLTVNAEGDNLDGYVTTLSPEEFRTMALKTIKAIHKYKWRKVKEFLLDSPLDTIVFLFKAPWPLIRRMFIRTSV